MYSVGDLIFVRMLNGTISFGVVTSEGEAGKRSPMVSIAIHDSSGKHAGDSVYPLGAHDIISKDEVLKRRGGTDIVLQAYAWLADKDVG